VTEQFAGNELTGSFQLEWDAAANGNTGTGWLSPAIRADAEEAEVLLALRNMPNSLVDTRNGYVVVEREVLATVDSVDQMQVKGYKWTITFASNVFSGVDTYGADATWDADGKYPKGWGRNVGNVPALGCVTSGGVAALETTAAGATPRCEVCFGVDCVDGTDPVSGVFRLTLDSTLPGGATANEASDPCPSCFVRTDSTTGDIPHNAKATIAEALSLGLDPETYSVEGALEALANVGDVSVSRSAANAGTGA
jgi:hypothetical protein